MSKKAGKVMGYSPYQFVHTTHFDEVFQYSQDCKEHGFDGIHTFFLWGGQDIHPSLYGQKVHTSSECYPGGLTERDVWEKKAILYCKANSIPIVGICRGAQLLCAMAGGKVIQDVSGHQHSHEMTVVGGHVVPVNSAHHQMMYPYDVPHELIGWSTKNRSIRYEAAEFGKAGYPLMFDSKEPEIVFFPGLRGLAIQPHPEWGSASPEFRKLTNDLIRKYALREEAHIQK